MKALAANQAVMFSVVDYQLGQKPRVMCPYFGVARFEDIDWKDLVAGDVTMIILTGNTL